MFTANLKNLAAIIKRDKPKAPAGAVRWKGGQPNKVWTSRVIKAPVDKVWDVMRDFAGMGAWHGDITKMHMLKKVRSDKVSGVRDFYFGDGHSTRNCCTSATSPAASAIASPSAKSPGSTMSPARASGR